MAKIKRLLPFRFLPGSWGLSGPAFSEAEAYYTLDGMDLKRRLIEIKHADNKVNFDLASLELDRDEGKVKGYEYALRKLQITGADTSRAILTLKLEHGLLSPYEHAQEYAKTEHPTGGIELEISLLKVDYDFRKISRTDYEREVANLREQPWVGVVDHAYDAKEGLNGFRIELDWNDLWIDRLRMHGYGQANMSEDQIIELWFNDVCAGNFDQDEMISIPIHQRLPIVR